MMTCTRPDRKCEICRKAAATVVARKLFGDRSTLICCDGCKPDANKRPAALRNQPFWYDVTPLAE
jgi:hypothetical protein